jgi:hypothetical protein
MKTQFDVHRLIEKGEILSELDFERALVAERKLRVLAKKDPDLYELRSRLRDLIERYENKHWSQGSEISRERLIESDIAETIAEKERRFILTRKELIKAKLKVLQMTQQDLGVLLGHNSKSYMSELMNGIKPFTLKNLIIIHRVLKIDLKDLIPTYLSRTELTKLQASLDKLGIPGFLYEKGMQI